MKKVKRCGHGFTCFEHYRLRVLLHTGGVTWPHDPHHPHQNPLSPLQRVEPDKARDAGCEWLHADFDDSLKAFYYQACGFTPTSAGLIPLE